MNKNKKNQRIITENQRIKDAYNAWVASGEPAIDLINNTTLPQDPAKPYKRCYNGHDAILKQLPKQWFIREDMTLITFKERNKILAVPHVVHTNPEMDRPCYSIYIKNADDKTSTKQIPNYDLMTLVWHPERIYGTARQLLEQSLVDNLGKRDAQRNKVHGHHYKARENDNAVMFHDTLAHDFCHDAPLTDAVLTPMQELKFAKDFGKIAAQESHKASVFIKDSLYKNGFLSAQKKDLVVTRDELNKLWLLELISGVRYILTGRQVIDIFGDMFDSVKIVDSL